MQPNLQPVQPPPLRVFHDSLDWRFLLPISDPVKIHVAFDGDVDFGKALDRIEIPASNRFSLSAVQQAEEGSVCSFALPFGLPAHWVSARWEEQIDFYRSIRRLICPSGYFLLGFANAWNSGSTAQPQYHASTPRRVRSQLSQAGFQSIKIFGAISDLRVPEYIFELNDRATYFALHHRFQRKPILLNGFRILARTIGLAHISKFLPCYFVVATA